MNFNERKDVFSRNDGYVSVEAVIAMSFFFIIFFLTLAFFTYVQPYSNLQREVHTLATIAERQGGLTNEDILEFETKLQAYSFINESPNPIIVTATTSPSGTDVSNVTPLGEEGNDYVPRSSKEIITVTAVVPANSAWISAVANFLGVTNISDTYTLSETVMSERY